MDREDFITAIFIILVALTIFMLGGIMGACAARPDDQKNKEAYCTSIYGVYGSDKCYLHGEEVHAN